MALSVTAIIERSSESYYSIHTIEHFDNFGLYGYGETPEKAKEDYQRKIDEERLNHLKDIKLFENGACLEKQDFFMSLFIEEIVSFVRALI